MTQVQSVLTSRFVTLLQQMKATVGGTLNLGIRVDGRFDGQVPSCNAMASYGGNRYQWMVLTDDGDPAHKSTLAELVIQVFGRASFPVAVAERYLHLISTAEANWVIVQFEDGQPELIRAETEINP